MGETSPLGRASLYSGMKRVSVIFPASERDPRQCPVQRPGPAPVRGALSASLALALTTRSFVPSFSPMPPGIDNGAFGPCAGQ